MVGDILPGQLLAEEGEGQAAEVRSATGASHDDVGCGLAGLGQLEEGLLADDGLVQQDVVEDAAQCVADFGVLGRDLDGLGDGDAERARVLSGSRPGSGGPPG